MNLQELLAENPLVVSVQGSLETLRSPATLLQLARASVESGAKLLRLEGIDAIREIKSALGVPVIGLVKREYPDSEVYITPTLAEVDPLLEAGCEIIALDGTARPRPGGATFEDLCNRIHEAGRWVMADCDTLENAATCIARGADLIGTTLSGYTAESTTQTSQPNLELVAQISKLGKPVIAEGRYAEAWQVQAARSAGATSVVIGGAINDPVKMTRVFRNAATRYSGPVLAVDIGGTWIRFAKYQDGHGLHLIERVPLPRIPEERTNLIASYAVRAGATRVGISTGGTVDPRTTEVWEAKPIIPGHQGTNFRAALPGLEIFSLNDGLATAWGHAQIPDYVGKRVVTLALGTGVGMGVVDRGHILMGARGEYPRLNDLSAGNGESFEDLLGGAALSPNPTEEQMALAQRAGTDAFTIVNSIFHPEAVILCGGVGLAGWLKLPAIASPFGHDAGLYGAAMLAITPPSELA